MNCKAEALILLSLFSGLACDLMCMDSLISLWCRWSWWSNTCPNPPDGGLPRHALPMQRWLLVLTPMPACAHSVVGRGMRRVKR